MSALKKTYTGVTVKEWEGFMVDSHLSPQLVLVGQLTERPIAGDGRGVS